jgi:hypothetical protein
MGMADPSRPEEEGQPRPPMIKDGNLQFKSVSSSCPPPGTIISILKLAKYYYSTVVTHHSTTSSQDNDEVEHQTLVRCTPKLVTALSGSPLSIADQLLAKGFMSEEVYRRLQKPSLGGDDMAREMVARVRGAVQLNSSKYTEFVQILQSDISLLSTGVIDTLHDTYSAIKLEQGNL